MGKKNFVKLYYAIILLVSFVLWTILIRFIDVKAIGPQKSTVGFATINKLVHTLTGVNMKLYNITDWLGLVPIVFAFGFALFGLIQWVKRKHIKKVDCNILLLGGFYIIVMMIYVLFEYVVINYRPVLINGILETSYPSSTTMLVMCVMPTAIMQFNHRINSLIFKYTICILITVFIAFMVLGRLVSGVHWFTDIVGGVLFSSGIVILYNFLAFKSNC